MKREYPKRPIIGVGAVIIRNGELLIVQRGAEPGMGKWSVPGGLVKLGESVQEAVVREVREECGFEVETKGLIDAVTSIVRDNAGRVKYHFVILDFLARLQGGDLQLFEVLDAKWVSLEETVKYESTDTFKDFLARNQSLLKRLCCEDVDTLV